MTKPNRKQMTTLGDSQLRAAVGGAPSIYNQPETLASSVQKKRDDTSSGVASKI